MEKFEVMTMNNEPRGAGIGLDDVFWLRAGIFETGGSMFENNFGEDFV